MRKMTKILLHACCAPCSTSVIETFEEIDRFRDRIIADSSEFDNVKIAVFYYNPNIEPEEEYEKRLGEVRKLCKNKNLGLIEFDYDNKNWRNLIKGLEDCKEGGERCKLCFKMRLEITAKYAKKNGFDFFTTTLTVSPHKNSEVINELGKDISEKENIKFLECNFKRKNGYKDSIELSKKKNIYRQNYCGCSFSMRK
jgi:predicted adenine nucleotide alpha hydrolase (AANH) superfamily ATPase